jgi:large subunit ribosomal protein L15
MPLYRRLAHRGFSNYPFKKEFQTVNLGEIEKRYEASETVDAASLIRKGLVKGIVPVKILGDGDLTKKLSFKVAAISASAKDKIEKAGGEVTVYASAERPARGKAGGKHSQAAKTAKAE